MTEQEARALARQQLIELLRDPDVAAEWMAMGKTALDAALAAKRAEDRLVIALMESNADYLDLKFIPRRNTSEP